MASILLWLWPLRGQNAIRKKTLNRSLRGAECEFYHDLLGLTKVGVSEATTGTMHRLRFGTSDVKLIDPTHRPGMGPIGIDQQLGFRYLTFVVTNLDEVIQRLEAEHIAFTRPKTTIRPGTTIAMVKDPDGNIVEFVERG